MEEEGALASTVPHLFNDAGLLKLLLLGKQWETPTLLFHFLELNEYKMTSF